MSGTLRGKRVLLIGGTGPTGPLVVDGLLDRGAEVTVLNTGRRPATFAGDVERIVADPHFLEPLETALGGREFDIAIAQYGRLRLVAEVLAGRTERLIALGGMFYPGWIDPAATVRPSSETGVARDWSVTYLDEAAPVGERMPLEPVGGMGRRVVETDTDIRTRHQRGDFLATLLRYPRVYGPGQLGAAEWSIVRRILEGRRRIILPEGGFLTSSVLYNENAARIVLAACERGDDFAGAVLNCADPDPITSRKWVRLIAEALDAEVEIVSLPMELAELAWPYARFPLTAGHHILDTSELERRVSGLVPTAVGLQRTARWYAADPAGRGESVEAQLKDPFDYALEDRVLEAFDGLHDRIRSLGSPDLDMSHPYSHPTAPHVDGGARP
ncbi:MAG TPA: hypothetical protein VNQ48_06240 [Microbacteriaceae bacterium]|nr:hypothetical protein [Microbacteriaceae bacterium]